ncbi:MULTISPECIES: SRPBCC family protein [unclassified Crossiella]|uniref:SRPBCC family protein n=1 Tax=unclassified Crossiella TaxID=2620835 RepID=UPI001FFED0EF|nr:MULTISPECIES: SRPBCC family protein [unclassified Crossiella]MCK2238530.1 SRPBCC family protein [Crossiella sp. S99.2]MCK2251900.1 SRPBCC family protein [Crossiella sp. S99.1]
MIDIAQQLAAIHRAVGNRTLDESDVVAVTLRREYEAEIADVWDAVTDPDRVRRWFLPLSGDLREGGAFQLEGNAGGDILTCQAPRLLKVTFGGPVSLVTLTLTEGGKPETTVLELDHTVPKEMAGSGAGALYVGPGWDGAFLGLALYLAGERTEDPVAAANSTEGQTFSLGSVRAWEQIVRESGTATEEELAAAVEVSLAQFAPALQDPKS